MFRKSIVKISGYKSHTFHYAALFNLQFPYLNGHLSFKLQHKNNQHKQHIYIYIYCKNKNTIKAKFCIFTQNYKPYTLTMMNV